VTGYPTSDPSAGGRGHAARRTSPLFVIPSIAAAVLAVLPLAYLFVRAGENGVERFLEVLQRFGAFDLLLRTVMLALATVAGSVALALPLAWLVTRTDLPYRRFFAVLFALPLVFPSYLGAFAFVTFFGPRGLLRDWLGAESIPEIAYGFDGAVVVIALFSYPYLYLPLVAALREMDPAIEESALLLSGSRPSVFRRVVLPQLRRPLAGGALLVALYTVSDFGAVSIVRFETFTLGIYNAYLGLFDRSIAASLATILVVLTAAILFLDSRVSRSATSSRTRAARKPVRYALKSWKWPALIFSSTVVMVTLAMPVVVIATWSANAGDFAWTRIAEAARGSFTASFAAAMVATSLAVPVAVWVTRSSTTTARFFERAIYSGYALPGIVIALAIVFFATRVVPAIYQTLPLLVVAYVIRFTPEAAASSTGALASISPLFEDAARALGASQWSAMRRVILPMAWKGIAAGGALVFLTAMKELPATLILRPTGYETLATLIWTATAESAYGEAAIPAALLLVISGVPIYHLVIRPALSENE
jgi:iron(III) transport system permease protein